jgi:hypothetical protein
MGIGYLRTLGRLERVSVIFRRLDSDFADHLELRAHSALGVPGLVDVIRAGNVGKANALGGGVVESPALDAHLPNASRAVRRGPTASQYPDGTVRNRVGSRGGVIPRWGAASCATPSTPRPLFSRGSSARLGNDLTDEQVAGFVDDIERRT